MPWPDLCLLTCPLTRPVQRIVLNLDERDASELVLAIGGYYLLSTGRTLSVRQDSSVQQDDAGRTGWGGVARPVAYPKWSAGT